MKLKLTESKLREMVRNIIKSNMESNKKLFKEMSEPQRRKVKGNLIKVVDLLSSYQLAFEGDDRKKLSGAQRTIEDLVTRL